MGIPLLWAEAILTVLWVILRGSYVISRVWKEPVPKVGATNRQICHHRAEKVFFWPLDEERSILGCALLCCLAVLPTFSPRDPPHLSFASQHSLSTWSPSQASLLRSKIFDLWQLFAFIGLHFETVIRRGWVANRSYLKILTFGLLLFCLMSSQNGCTKADADPRFRSE